MRNAISAKSTKERASIAIGLIKARRTNSRAFSDCFEMGDGDGVIQEILRRAARDPEIERRYPHVREWRKTFMGNEIVRGQHVMAVWHGKELIGTVRHVASDGTLDVRHFNGESWPFKPNVSDVEAL